MSAFYVHLHARDNPGIYSRPLPQANPSNITNESVNESKIDTKNEDDAHQQSISN